MQITLTVGCLSGSKFCRNLLAIHIIPSRSNDQEEEEEAGGPSAGMIRWIWIGLFAAEVWFGLYWIITQSVRWNHIYRYTFKDRLSLRYGENLPRVDIFVCTADPTIEPPTMVINTVLSVMAYDYPPEKLSVYLSDDGGSDLTFYALFEASRFAKYWIPFCKKFKVEPRSPAAYFAQNSDPPVNVNDKEWLVTKLLYEDMKHRIEEVIKLGRVPEEIREQHKGFSEWNSKVTKHDHQTILQILIHGRDPSAVDTEGHQLPTLVYLAREKRPQYPHNFKAGAINSLLRVSSAISNGQMILSVDCDMYSNDSGALRDALCFLMDEEQGHDIAFVQCPQNFNNVTKSDLYANGFKVINKVELTGLDGSGGSIYSGTGCFHRRESLCGRKFTKDYNENWNRKIEHSKEERSVSELEETSKVLADCTYEENTEWGKEMGLKYGCPVEDVITGLAIQCRGWKSVYYNPERKCFLGVAPTTLDQALVQYKRWSEGLFQIFLSKYCPFFYGRGKINLGLQMGYCIYSLWAPNSFPAIFYLVVPSLCFLNGIPLFPKLSSLWFLPFAYVFITTNLYSLVEALMAGDTIKVWWNLQRIWVFRRQTSFLFSFIDTVIRQLGFSQTTFVITAKVVDDDVQKRYEQEMLEFGSPSPMFAIIATVAVLNLFSLLGGVIKSVIMDTELWVFNELISQFIICGLMVLINRPVYEALFLRKDNGRIPFSVMFTSIVVASFACLIPIEDQSDEEDEYLPLFQTNKAKAQLLAYRFFSISVFVSICLVWVYRAKYVPLPGGGGGGGSSSSKLGTWAWMGLFAAEIWFGFYWFLTQSLRWNPISRHTFKDRLFHRYEERLPSVDIFVCTADPTIEPPTMVINTVLSVMAYDYPPEKLSVYLSDDGGSDLTFYALLEASHFSKYWIPFCKKFKVEPRSPAAYFSTTSTPIHQPASNFEEWSAIKILFEEMEVRIETATRLGRIPEEMRAKHKGFSEWASVSSPRDHQTILQILIDGRDSNAVDMEGCKLPTLVYLAREKRPQHHHNFKAGAMNALIRVSSTISNGQIILNVDCDMYSNSSESIRDALCFFMDEEKGHEIAYVQFPQNFNNISKHDLYGGALAVIRDVEFCSMDGNGGPLYIGSGCFHRRDTLLGKKYSKGSKGDQWKTNTTVTNQVLEESVDELEDRAKGLANCNYEENTQWGNEMGLKYGYPVEDVLTGLTIQCRGWKSVYFNPKRWAFLGVAPNTLGDVLVQHKRWSEGDFQIFLSKYNPFLYGHQKISLALKMGYSTYCLWVPNCFPTLYYLVIPPLCLLKGIPLFPKITSPWFLPFMYLIITKYTYSLVEFLWSSGTLRGWWHEQRMWMFKRTTSYLFAFIDSILKLFGFAKPAFVITTKVTDGDVSKRYEQDMIEFGSSSPIFTTIIATLALINLFSLVGGLKRVFIDMEAKVLEQQLIMQIGLCGLVVLINLPVYQGLFFRKDKGRIPTSITLKSVILAALAYDEYVALFETKEAKGRLAYRLFSVSIFIGICLVWVYRAKYVPTSGGDGGGGGGGGGSSEFILIRRWAWMGLFGSEIWFTLYWLFTQSVRWNLIYRRTFKHRLSQRYEERLPGVDVFVCTADPTIEPPTMVINTVLSMMAYNYPPEKLSVYLSDEGGSDLTFYALLEASHFSKYWIPFCKKFNVEPRSPAVYFLNRPARAETRARAREATTAPNSEEWSTIKILYEEMKNRIETATKLGRIPEEMRAKHKGFSEWASVSSPRDHQTILQILIDGREPNAVDVEGCKLPTLVYLAREKRPQHHHNFKAGAMNALIRVSSEISNGQIILNVDCDMYSNNSESIRDALCFFMDEEKSHEIAFVQYPQIFNNISRHDLYGGALSVICQVELPGLDGNGGPGYIGTGCFHRRETLLGKKYSKESCRGDQWKTESGLTIQCRGWRSVYFIPKRPGFLGVAPNTLGDTLVQHKRWSEGNLQIFLSKYNSFLYGNQKISLGLQMGYCVYNCWSPNCLPTLYYLVIPPLCLLKGIPLFPKCSKNTIEREREGERERCEEVEGEMRMRAKYVPLPGGGELGRWAWIGLFGSEVWFGFYWLFIQFHTVIAGTE
ncbi:Cellulose synthase [Macleaya cordata]|uniref:Cellulose synthase n=1 Tax=Macleaya cordata TaxID=56857 RepID=A0A200RAR0_MACCD|nr:Cellulose synthase [Macleaya cordata]